MIQKLLVTAIKQNEDVIKLTSLIKQDVEISHDVFQRTAFLVDDIAQAIRENNKGAGYPVNFYITSLKEKRNPKSAHDLDNEKIAVDLQIILPGEEIYKNSKNYKIHLAINLLWIMYLKTKVPAIEEILIGAGRSTYHIHAGDKHLYENRSFYEMSIKNQVRDSGLLENKSSLQLLKMIPKSSTYTRLIPRIYLKKKLELTKSEIEVIQSNTFEALTLDPITHGIDNTIEDYAINVKVLLSVGVAVLSMLIFKEITRK